METKSIRNAFEANRFLRNIGHLLAILNVHISFSIIISERLVIVQSFQFSYKLKCLHTYENTDKKIYLHRRDVSILNPITYYVQYRMNP